VSCSALALAAGEHLAGTATVARRWLLVEVRGAWGRDAVADSGLRAGVRRRLDDWLAEDGGSRVLFLRRPDRRDGPLAVYRADSDEDGGELRRLTLPFLEALPEADLERGEPVEGQLVLVCAHGRRDPCCARHGPPAFDALSARIGERLLWQSSHQGGHRFAANVLVLPDGISLGRVAPEDADAVAAELAAGRIPLARFRGRTMYPPEAQAAEAAVRQRFGLQGLTDVRLLAAAPGRVVLRTPDGRVEATVETRTGPSRPESCGADPAPATVYSVRW
jgi:hypothetical protein